MNLEQRSKILNLINQTYGLLAYAIKNSDGVEIERLKQTLAYLLEKVEE